MTRRLSTRRTAMTYLVVLGSTMLVTAAGLAALFMVRVNRRSLEGSSDFTEARFLAQSAVELGQLDIRRTSDWRSSKPHGTWRNNEPLGRGTLTVTVTDMDGNLADDPSDPVTLTGVGIVGHASYRLIVELEPEQPGGMDSLNSAVHTASELDVNSDLTVVGAPASSNGLITIGALGTVVGDILAGTLTNLLGTLIGTESTSTDPKEMPLPSAFDYYIANAVQINFAALSGGELRNVVLSPTSNPFGQTHPSGLYLINCGGAKITIRDARINGSLILLDPGTGSEVIHAINWEVYDPKYPAMMVRGNISFAWKNDLDESVLGVNFNPETDSDKKDTYPTRLVGLAYVSGNLTITDPAEIQGMLLTAGPTLEINAPTTVIHDPTIVLNPPKGFERANRPMTAMTGTWRQSVN